MVERVNKLENMVALEKTLASGLSASVEKLSNVVVREILKSIAHDSQKHAGLYVAILNLTEGRNPAIIEEDYERLRTIIERHIGVEEKMIQEVKQLLDTEKDSRVKHLLLEIHQDEDRHHILMRNILKAVIKHETIFEKDVWDMLWKDAPGHGAP
jgi:rubrerythrin